MLIRLLLQLKRVLYWPVPYVRSRLPGKILSILLASGRAMSGLEKLGRLPSYKVYPWTLPPPGFHLRGACCAYFRASAVMTHFKTIFPADCFCRKCGLSSGDICTAVSRISGHCSSSLICDFSAFHTGSQYDSLSQSIVIDIKHF